MNGKVMEFEKNLKNHGKVLEFCEIICVSDSKFASY